MAPKLCFLRQLAVRGEIIDSKRDTSKNAEKLKFKQFDFCILEETPSSSNTSYGLFTLRKNLVDGRRRERRLSYHHCQQRILPPSHRPSTGSCLNVNGLHHKSEVGRIGAKDLHHYTRRIITNLFQINIVNLHSFISHPTHQILYSIFSKSI